MCRDEAGVGLLHKAVFYDYMDIATWLVKQCPELVHDRDSVSSVVVLYVVRNYLLIRSLLFMCKLKIAYSINLRSFFQDIIN
jgi:hypothetical protein